VLGNGNLDYLEQKYVCFGVVAEGLESLTRINQLPISGGGSGRDRGVPLRVCRIKHATLLGSPFAAIVAGRQNHLRISAAMIEQANANLISRIRAQCPKELLPLGDPLYETSKQMAEEFVARVISPIAHPDFLVGESCMYSDEDDDGHNSLVESAELRKAANQAKADETRALMMQVLSGIPDTDVVPPENVLFVCRLNPVTDSEGLAACFARCGAVKCAEVIRNAKNGASMRYGFVEFETVEMCNRAYQKMENILLDDSRIHVDFSQSVSKIWAQKRKQKLHHYVLQGSVKRQREPE
jgi:peptidyl-prolyl cis-trans isomerase-like 4